MKVLKVKGVSSNLSLQETNIVSGVSDTSPNQNVDQVLIHVNTVDTPVTGAPTVSGNLATNNDSLAEYLSRPINIITLNTTIGNLAFSPWGLFLNHIDIRDKTRYYSHLRGTLVLNFLMPDLSFVAGRVMISYDPYVTDKVIRSNTTALSNLPHVILDPGITNNVMLKIPFHDNYDYFDLTSPTFFPDAEIITTIMTVFTNVSTLTPTNANIRVLAHLEDVELKTSSVQPQSSSGEWSPNGPISQVASTVVQASDVLGKLPLIGKFAKATGNIANAIGAVSSIFGFTKPVVVTPPIFVKNRAMGDMATTNGLDTAGKLTFDIKSERTIDPRLVYGSNGDELVIADIAARPSYMGVVTWTDSDALGVNLFTLPMSPCMYNGIGNEVHMSNSCFAAAPFQFWRGSLRVDLSLVKTKFNKGKLRVCWTLGTSTPTADDTHRGYNIIWDISEQSELTILVPFNNRQRWLMTSLMAFPGTIQANQTNGVLYVEVMEQLSGPGDISNVDLQVWTSAGSDFQVAVPTLDHIANLVVREPTVATMVIPSEVEQPWFASGLAGSAPSLNPMVSGNIQGVVAETTEICIAPDAIDNEACLINLGETIVSFRDVMKRYCGLRTIPSGDITFVPTLPQPPGYARSAVGVGTSHNLQTILTYLIPSYFAVRGSTRVKLALPDVIDGQPLMVTRAQTLAWAEEVRSLPPRLVIGGSWQGSQFSLTSIDGVLETELPNYTRYNFVKTNSYLHDYFRSFNGIFVDNSGSASVCHVYQSAADDFTLDWYLGPPVFYNYLCGPGIPLV